MNQRDISRIAKSLSAAARHDRYETQSKASLWHYYLEATATALAECNPDFDRAAFLAECKGPGGKIAGQEFIARLEESQQ